MSSCLQAPGSRGSGRARALVTRLCPVSSRRQPQAPLKLGFMLHAPKSTWEQEDCVCPWVFPFPWRKSLDLQLHPHKFASVSLTLNMFFFFLILLFSSFR